MQSNIHVFLQDVHFTILPYDNRKQVKWTDQRLVRPQRGYRIDGVLLNMCRETSEYTACDSGDTDACQRCALYASPASWRLTVNVTYI